MNTLFIDIETVPSGDMPTLEEMLPLVPGNYKKKESIDEWANDPVNQEAVYRKRALSWWDCRVFCIAFAMDDGDVVSLHNNDEKSLLIDFQSNLLDIKPDTLSIARWATVGWCGHNIKKFDLPILYLRALKYGLTALTKMIPTEGRSSQILDTMEMYALTSYREYISLDTVSKFFGVQSKSKMDGSQVYDYHKAGKFEEIAEYCAEDVEVVRRLYSLLR